jgi:hypothetical protein
MAQRHAKAQSLLIDQRLVTGTQQLAKLTRWLSRGLVFGARHIPDKSIL